MLGIHKKMDKQKNIQSKKKQYLFLSNTAVSREMGDH